MGLWRADTFENSEALDWLSDLLDENDLYFVHNTLEIIADYPPGEQPDSWDCICALAAAELVAAARGEPPEIFPPVAAEWVEAYGLEPDEELMDFSTKAVERIGTNSWLKNEWDEAEDNEKWYHSLTDLKRRLGHD